MTQSTLPPAGRLTFFHGTNAKFKKFSLDHAARPGMSGNGHLGVWLACDRELAQRFGEVCMEVEAEVSKAYHMPISVLATMNRACYSFQSKDAGDDDSLSSFEARFYTDYRNTLVSQGFDMIYLVEIDGRIDMAIGLIPDRLAIM